MGGSSKKPTDPAATPAASQQPMMTVQPAMPGQLEAIAQQLGAGFGQPAPDMLDYIRQFHRPMQVPDYSPRPATTPAPATPTPTTPGGAKRGAQELTQPDSRMIFNRQRGGGS